MKLGSRYRSALRHGSPGSSSLHLAAAAAAAAAAQQPCIPSCCRDEADKPPPLRPGKVSPMREVPAHIPRPPYAETGAMPDWDPNPQVRLGSKEMCADQTPCLALLQPSTLHMLPDGVRQLAR